MKNWINIQAAGYNGACTVYEALRNEFCSNSQNQFFLHQKVARNTDTNDFDEKLFQV